MDNMAKLQYLPIPPESVNRTNYVTEVTFVMSLLRPSLAECLFPVPPRARSDWPSTSRRSRCWPWDLIYISGPYIFDLLYRDFLESRIAQRFLYILRSNITYTSACSTSNQPLRAGPCVGGPRIEMPYVVTHVFDATWQHVMNPHQIDPWLSCSRHEFALEILVLPMSWIRA
jgi:hypothetical protein